MMKDSKLDKIILGTGNYKNVLSGNTVSVTGDGGNAWGYFGASYKKLAPRLVTYTPYAKKYEELQKIKADLTRLKEYQEKRREIEEEYIKSYYETRLKDLDARDLLETLYEKFGDNIILLCHESVDEFCHRRLIADFIEIKLGIYIPEVEVDKKEKIKYLKPIRYKERLEKYL